jgi:nucleoside-diphosphate-sugar epimerase
MFEDVDIRCLDLRNPDACQSAVANIRWIYNQAANMGGMGLIKRHKAECMLSVLINTNLLIAAKQVGVERFFCIVGLRLSCGEANQS